MILNISGRTDIVAFYTPWLMNRLKEGFIDVRNPFNKKLVSRILLEKVDAIMFCTKNPLPIIPYLKEIEKPIIFHTTITPYLKDIEPNLPNKKDIIEGVKKISKIIGSEYTYIRFDPIFINQKYTLDYHIKMFERLCTSLEGYVKHIIISFLDDYKNVRKNIKILNPKTLTKEDYKKLGTSFATIAKEHNMTVQTCFEDENMVEYGFEKRDCLGKELAEELTGKTKFKKWKARKENKCNCIEMVDIGVYNTCSHFCKYCYANYDEKEVLKNKKLHNPNSSLLIGELEGDDIIKIRKE